MRSPAFYRERARACEAILEDPGLSPVSRRTAEGLVATYRAVGAEAQPHFAAVAEARRDDVPDDDATRNGDARFLADVIYDTERWTRAGIAEGDLGVVFEMDARCSWGAGFSVARFRRALRSLGELPGVEKRGDRWFPSTSRTLEEIDETGGRLCGRPGCGAQIGHLQANARYCSDGCRNRVRRTQQRARTPVHRPRSEPREMARNRAPGISGPHVGFQGPSGPLSASPAVR